MGTRPKQLRVNAMSTRVRPVGTVGDGKSGSMSDPAGKVNLRNQRLGTQVTEISRLLESLGFWLIT